MNAWFYCLKTPVPGRGVDRIWGGIECSYLKGELLGLLNTIAGELNICRNACWCGSTASVAASDWINVPMQTMLRFSQ